MRTSDFSYHLPEDLIAVHPPVRREDSRMLVLDRATGRVSHRMFRDLPGFMEPGDLAVLNDTRVIPARLTTRDPNNEILLLEKLEVRTWLCIVRPGRRFRSSARVSIADTVAEVLEIRESGERVVRFDDDPDLDTHGAMPLPPYLRRPAQAEDRERYQTVFAAQPGAVAAPTAGLHFTPQILAAIPHVFVTLHVGPGTFVPVKVADLRDHQMHEERFAISQSTADAILGARRVLAVGTTTVRVLETLAAESAGVVRAGEGRTSIFIYPPHEFRAVDRLLTNFHLPQSTLLMLVSAFAGREAVLHAYAEAVRERYRFFSYGDCMLVL